VRRDENLVDRRIEYYGERTPRVAVRVERKHAGVVLRSKQSGVDLSFTGTQRRVGDRRPRSAVDSSFGCETRRGLRP